MERLYYRSLYDELNDMRAYMDSLFQQMEEPQRIALLPAAGKQAKMLPDLRGGFKVDVTERDDEVIVRAVMIAGVVKRDISIDLINPLTLEISGERKEEKKRETGGYYVHERSFGSMTRVIPLPSPVTEEGAKALFKNSILEIHLRKELKDPGKMIPVE